VASFLVNGLGDSVKFFRFGVLSVIDGKKIDVGLIFAIIGVLLAWANAAVFQLFANYYENEVPSWREDLGAETWVYVFDTRIAIFWGTAALSLVLLFIFYKGVAIPLLLFGAWATVIDRLIISNVGGEDVLRDFADLEETATASVLPLYVFTSLVILVGLFLLIWPNRGFISERLQTLSVAERLAISLLVANALSYQLYFNQMGSQGFDWRDSYGVEEAVYTADGRLIIAWLLGIGGILAFFVARGILKWLLVIHWFWAVFLDEIFQGTIGGEDVWNLFGQEPPFAAIQQLQGFIGLLISLTAIWLFTGWYRKRVIAWMDKKGAEITKDSEDFEHTSPIAIIAIVLAFLFPLGGLVLAAIAKREIALSKSNVGGVNLVVAANITAIVVLILQFFVLLSVSFDFAQLFLLIENLFATD